MTARRTLAAREMTDIFDQAVRDRAIASLSIHENNEWINFKSRFLERDPRSQYFVLDYVSIDGTPLPELGPGRFVGVSFRYRSRKVLFATTVHARGHFMLENRTSISAVRYRWPDTLTELQRRVYYRTPIPESQVLLAKVWPNGISMREEAETAEPTLTGQLTDISCGGAFLRVNQSEVPEWAENKTLGVELQLGDGKPPLSIDARYRGSRRDQYGQLGVAIQFIGLELTVDGRLALQRLAGCVQRFHRNSLLSGVAHWNR